MSRVWCELKLKNIFIVSKMASFQNLQIPDIQICASLVLRLNRQEPWKIQGFVMLISILVPNWWLITFRCIPTTWTFQVFSMNSDARHIKGVGSCVVMMRPDGVGKRAIVLPKMQWVVLVLNNTREGRDSVLTIMMKGMISERRDFQIFPGQARRCTEDMALDSCPCQKLGRTYF